VASAGTPAGGLGGGTDAPVATRGPTASHGRPSAPDIALILGSIASIQISAAVATHMFDTVGALGATLIRNAIAAVVVFVLVRPALRGLSRSAWRAVIPYGIALGVMNGSFYLGLERVDLGTAVAIEFLGPLTVGAVFARRARDRAWVLVAAIGVLALTRPWSDAHADPVGVAWLLVAAACWGAYIPLGGRAARELPGLQPVALALGIAALIALVPGVVESGSDLFDPHVLLIGLVAATAGSVVPYSLEQLALRRVAPGVFGVLMALEPGVAALAGLVVLGQGLPALSVLGLALVVAAGVGVTRAAPSSGPATAVAAAGPDPAGGPVIDPPA
jgi:inner membrane transporter RhtA